MTLNKTNICNTLFYAGLTKDEYLEIKPAIYAKNRSTLNWSSLLTSLFFAVLSAVSFVPWLNVSVGSKRILYIFAFVFSIIVFVFSKFILKKKSRLSLGMSYAFLTGAFVYGILLGTAFSQEIPSTTFCVLLFALPLLIVDKPYRVALLLFATTVAFCISSSLIKDSSVFALDFVNSTAFTIFGIAVGFIVQKTKIVDHQNRLIIERERDTDGLTSLLTKTAAEKRINAYIREKKISATMIMFDIDSFKSINDSYGHFFGDVVLREVSKAVSSVFGEQVLKSRFGGDEFIVFIPESSSKSVCEALLKKLAEEMNKISCENSFLKEKITCSFGVAYLYTDASNYAGLLSAADAALYYSKNNGKGRYTFYEDFIKIPQ